jgi:hypothetical protein
MKTIKLTYSIFFCFMLIVGFSPTQSSAVDTAPLPERQWEAPVMPGGTLVKTEDTSILITYNLPYDAVLAWYKKVLENYKDEKYRDWKEQMYIEDQGGAKWHSIGISKGGGTSTTVKIVKDNWTWIFSTLFIRFAGVFIVLCLLWMLLNLSSFIMRKYIIKEEVKAKAG